MMHTRTSNVKKKKAFYMHKNKRRIMSIGLVIDIWNESNCVGLSIIQSEIVYV